MPYKMIEHPLTARRRALDSKGQPIRLAHRLEVERACAIQSFKRTEGEPERMLQRLLEFPCLEVLSHRHLNLA